MPKHRTHYRLGLSILLILAFVMAGCDKLGIAPPRALQTTEGYDAENDLVVAVGPDGSRNLAWTEQLFYNWTRINYFYSGPGGEKFLYFNSDSPGMYYAPSVTVTDDHTVYMAWSRIDYDTDEITTCWWSFNPAAVANTGCHPVANSAFITNKAPMTPVVVSYGNTVYLAYFGGNAGRIDLRVKRLSPIEAADEDTTISIDNSPSGTEFFTQPSLAVSSTGSLHLAIVRYAFASGSMKYILSYTKYSPGAVTPFDVVIDPNNMTAASIDIDRANSDRVYFGTVINHAKIFAQVRDNTGAPVATFADVLPPGNTWTIYGPASFTVVPFSNPASNLAYITFSGHTSTTGTDVYYCTFNGSSNCGLTPVTNDNDTTIESVPASVAAVEPDFSSIVIMWRQFNAGKYGDVYAYNGGSGVRKVFTSFGTNTSTQYRLASNGPYVAGAWIDSVSATNDRKVPWFSYNANLVYLPLTVR